MKASQRAWTLTILSPQSERSHQDYNKPLSEPRSPVLLCPVRFEMRRHCWSSQKSVRAHLPRSEPRPALIGCRGDTGKHRQVNLQCVREERWQQYCGINHRHLCWVDVNIDKIVLYFFLPQSKIKNYEIKSQHIDLQSQKYELFIVPSLFCLCL